jgi:hypothetical protein
MRGRGYRHGPLALPLDGGGLGGGGVSAGTEQAARLAPPQPLPIKGRGCFAEIATFAAMAGGRS